MRNAIVPFLLGLALAAAPARAQDGLPEDVLIVQLREDAIAYEHGESGFPKDPQRAAQIYCKAARLGDAASQFNLGWMYANSRGVERSDSLAAFFFHAAAEQGHEQAQRMLAVVGGPTPDVPECVRQGAISRAALEAAARLAPPPPPLRSTAPKYILELVRKHAAEQRVPPQLVLAIIEAESRFDPGALSPKGARGLMQLIPDTATRFGVRNAWDAAQNIRGGTAYLRWLMAYFEGDVSLVAAAYNAGEGTVERYRGVPPYVETRAYVRRIVQAVGTVAFPYDASRTAPSPQLRLIRQPQRAP